MNLLKRGYLVISEDILVKEYLLSTNNFEKPKELHNNNAVCMYLMRLILLEPGSIQSKPEMGVGLVSRWRYSDSTQFDGLKAEIQKQVREYLPEFQFTDVSISFNARSKKLYIDIDLNDIRYSFISTPDNILELYQL